MIAPIPKDRDDYDDYTEHKANSQVEIVAPAGRCFSQRGRYELILMDWPG
jgi:hypothetical protein